MFFRRSSRKLWSEDAFISFHFWLTNEEIAQLEEIARERGREPAAIVQDMVKRSLKEWREKASK